MLRPHVNKCREPAMSKTAEIVYTWDFSRPPDADKNDYPERLTATKAVARPRISTGKDASQRASSSQPSSVKKQKPSSSAPQAYAHPTTGSVPTSTALSAKKASAPVAAPTAVRKPLVSGASNGRSLHAPVSSVASGSSQPLRAQDDTLVGWVPPRPQAKQRTDKHRQSTGSYSASLQPNQALSDGYQPSLSQVYGLEPIDHLSSSRAGSMAVQPEWNRPFGWEQYPQLLLEPQLRPEMAPPMYPQDRRAGSGVPGPHPRAPIQAFMPPPAYPYPMFQQPAAPLGYAPFVAPPQLQHQYQYQQQYHPAQPHFHHPPQPQPQPQRQLQPQRQTQLQRDVPQLEQRHASRPAVNGPIPADAQPQPVLPVGADFDEMPNMFVQVKKMCETPFFAKKYGPARELPGATQREKKLLRRSVLRVMKSMDQVSFYLPLRHLIHRDRRRRTDACVTVLPQQEPGPKPRSAAWLPSSPPRNSAAPIPPKPKDGPQVGPSTSTASPDPVAGSSTISSQPQVGPSQGPPQPQSHVQFNPQPQYHPPPQGRPLPHARLSQPHLSVQVQQPQPLAESRPQPQASQLPSVQPQQAVASSSSTSASEAVPLPSSLSPSSSAPNLASLAPKIVAARPVLARRHPVVERPVPRSAASAASVRSTKSKSKGKEKAIDGLTNGIKRAREAEVEVEGDVSPPKKQKPYVWKFKKQPGFEVVIDRE